MPAATSSRTVNSRILFKSRLSATNTLASGAYSASNCRQAPQGIGPPGARATTATATKSFFPLGQRLEQRHPLRAAGQTVARALDVRAADDFAGFREQRRADLEFGIRGHRAFARLAPPRESIFENQFSFLGGTACRRPKFRVAGTATLPNTILQNFSAIPLPDFHPFGRFQHLGMGQFLFAAPGGQIGDTRNGRDVQAALPRHHRLRHGAHAHRVRAEPRKRADFRRRLVTRPANGEINARTKFHFACARRFEQQRIQLPVINLRQIHESWPWLRRLRRRTPGDGRRRDGRSGLAPMKLMWSVNTMKSPGRNFVLMPPAAFVSSNRGCRRPRARERRT